MDFLEVILQGVMSVKKSSTDFTRQTLSAAACLLCSLDVSLEIETSLEHFATVMTAQVNHFGACARVFMPLERSFVGEHFVTLVTHKGHD